ncbi:hypothetical protein [Staphylococcus americanisciuri]|uniref:Phage protein n=1 Tax=Staphylococcus americanisciuri TaxID=2973940 RepID=A0ABT2F0H9_9STAP|nr:hypothetical protein [Staphylococcus americanisciuri]MCS4485943.1 hypothetical protein [Staphylococcus americanisciuri]
MAIILDYLKVFEHIRNTQDYKRYVIETDNDMAVYLNLIRSLLNIKQGRRSKFKMKFSSDLINKPYHSNKEVVKDIESTVDIFYEDNGNLYLHDLLEDCYYIYDKCENTVVLLWDPVTQTLYLSKEYNVDLKQQEGTCQRYWYLIAQTRVSPQWLYQQMQYFITEFNMLDDTEMTYSYLAYHYDDVVFQRLIRTKTIRHAIYPISSDKYHMEKALMRLNLDVEIIVYDTFIVLKDVNGISLDTIYTVLDMVLMDDFEDIPLILIEDAYIADYHQFTHANSIFYTFSEQPFVIWQHQKKRS